MKITLDDEIEAASEVVEMYRNSWFVRRTMRRSRENQRLLWRGQEPENWRTWLAANATLRRLKRIRQSRRVSERNRTEVREAVKKGRGSRN